MEADVPRLGDQRHLRQHRVCLHRHEQRRPGVEVITGRPPERDGEVEAKTVDVILAHPVPQGIEHEPHDGGFAHVEGVAAAGHVDVLAVLTEPVGGRIVEPAQRQRRALVAALLARVVVDDVEDDLEPRRVQRPHHRLDLVDDPLRITRMGIRRVRREETERVVTPVVVEPELHQVRFVDERMHRQQFDARHAEIAQVRRHRRVREPRVGAAQFFGDVGMLRRQTLDVSLVDDAVGVTHLGAGVAAPVEIVADDDAARHERRGIAVVPHPGVARERVVDDVPKHFGPPRHLGADGARIGVEQQLRGVVTQARRGRPRSVRAVPVRRPGAGRRNERRPMAAVEARHRNARLARRGILRAEQAQFDGARVGCDDAEDRAVPLERDARTRGADEDSLRVGHANQDKSR